MSNQVDSIAGAILEAVRVGLSRSGTISSSTAQSIPRTASHSTPVSGTLYSGVSAISSSSSHPSGESSTSTSTSGSSSNSSSGTKRKFTVPTMFQPKSKRSKKEIKPKSVNYLRDIFCLPRSMQSSNGNIVIPRGNRRSSLAHNDVGLLGKIEFQSDWSAEKMNREICSVFTRPFGLSQKEIDNGELFPFQYLQRTGAGSRTLRVPTVSHSFEWNGRQVATLAKSGGIIYILATQDIPVLLESVSNHKLK